MSPHMDTRYFVPHPLATALADIEYSKVKSHPILDNIAIDWSQFHLIESYTEHLRPCNELSNRCISKTIRTSSQGDSISKLRI